MTLSTVSPDTFSDSQLLLGGNLNDLRAAVESPDSAIAPLWHHFLTLSRQDPEWFPAYSVLAALVTEEDGDRALARDAFMRYVALGPEAFSSEDAQFHTHTVSAPLGRWAIYYDWLADADLFTDRERESIEQTMLDHALVFGMQQLSGRIRRFDNQVLANAFGVAAVGYVLGIRRGQSALAQELLHTGMFWLLELLRQLPADGNSCEGSTYQEHVVLPVTLFSALLAEQVTGQRVMTEGLPPDGPPARRVLDTCRRLIGPGGLLPGWDDYGFAYANVKAGLVYLARLDRDPAPLAIIRDLNLWHRHALPAWEVDDRLWSLVWWPTDLDMKQAKAIYEPWMEPTFGAALQSESRRVRLFQYWDRCEGVPGAGRANADPNSITLEACGSIILVDGHGKIPQELKPIPRDTLLDHIGQRRIESLQEYVRGSHGGAIDDEQALARLTNGSVGQSNTLVFDDEAWYVPLDPCRGQGEAFGYTGSLQVVRSESAALYADRYDVDRVQRSSLLVGGQYVVTCDKVDFRSPHRVTWQAFLRSNAKVQKGRVVVRTPEQVRCDIIPLQAGELQLDDAVGYPRMPDGRSIRMHHSVPAADSVRLDVALLPQPCLRFREELTHGWQRHFGEQRDVVSLDQAYLSDSMTHSDQPRRFERTVDINCESGARYFLELAAASRHVELKVNGQLVEPVADQMRGIWPDSVCDLPWFFDLSEVLQSGENKLCLTVPSFHGETLCGPVWLHEHVEPAVVSAERAGPARFRIQSDEFDDDVILENTDGETGWAGGTTNARYAVCRNDGTLSAVDVTRIQIPESLSLSSLAPCDLTWSLRATSIAKLVSGTTIDLSWPGASLHIEYAGCLRVNYSGEHNYRIELEVPQRVWAFVNGKPIGQIGGTGEKMTSLELHASAVQPSSLSEVPQSAEDVLAIERSNGSDAIDALIAALGSDQWRVQMTAADALGRLRAHKSTSALIALLEAEEAQGSYPLIQKWWTWGRMLCDRRVDGPDPDMPRPAGEKRWRVKRAAITALGKMGDVQAAPVIEKLLTQCDDYFTVTSQLAVALGRIGSPTSVPVLQRHLDHAEVNTRIHARLAHDLLEGRIDRATFEARIGFA